VREYSSPALATIADGATLTDAVFGHATETPDAVLFRLRPLPADPTAWRPVTALEFATKVAGLARGFLAAGLQPGQRVGLLSRTRYEWSWVDYALWHAGLVTVPVYETSSDEQIAWILGDAQAVGVVVENSAHAQAIEAVRHQLPDLSNVWIMDDGALENLAATEGHDGDLAAARSGLDASSLATIIYTSGTTGRPKGCELTHRNLLFSSTSAVASLPDLFNEETTVLLFLPLAHVLAREIQVACMIAKVPVGHSPDTRSLPEDLASFNPTLLLAVPYVFEKLYTVAQQRAVNQRRGRIFDYATRVAIAASQGQQDGKTAASTRVLHALFDRLVYAKLRAALGGEVKWVISGGAPLGTRLGHFFRGAGTPVLEGWGLTETTGGAAVNRPDAVRIGTVGPPIAGTTVRVADDGELMVRGEHIFARYWRDPEATAAVRSDDGWLRSGDLGAIDDAGFVTITGRKKELLVTAGGKNVSPAVLEDRLRGNPLISQCMVVGDRRPYIACLITIDEAALEAWKAKVGRESDQGIAELRDDPELIAEVQAAVDEANRAVSRAESIRRFRILPVDFTEAGGQLTPTLKVRRSVVLEQFADEVEALYPTHAGAPEMAG
jgi:long-chain acyl-CoA synthetase